MNIDSLSHSYLILQRVDLDVNLKGHLLLNLLCRKMEKYIRSVILINNLKTRTT